MDQGIGRYGAASLLLGLTTVALTSGCATKKYVRTQVNTSANEISARMDEKDRTLQNGIDSNASQVTELSGVTREHSQQIGTLDTGLKATDGKATQAMTVGQGAQSTANQAIGHVSRLDSEFQNRNNYGTVSEHSIRFAFGSATLSKDPALELDQIAQQIKSSPDAILVLEGRTDSTGDAAYNIQLGEKRLDAVVRYLVVEQGVPVQRIYKMSFGEARPVAANDTREGRAQNRAVIVRMMEPNLNGGGAGQGSAIVSDAAPMTR
ncbi:MAG: OmpA family protein [Acidobacteria bacterium]|nr:OmpA family protein [Acidobacteriota bacterium]